ncbi:hypothetical protein [Croceiramulus getboli]|nr:hypothetical protein P8624_05215 [Flavobacteriaceae bacterium YJPT1-3]
MSKKEYLDIKIQKYLEMQKEYYHYALSADHARVSAPVIGFRAKTNPVKIV